jgi:hypothetical protein
MYALSLKKNEENQIYELHFHWFIFYLFGFVRRCNVKMNHNVFSWFRFLMKDEIQSLLHYYISEIKKLIFFLIGRVSAVCISKEIQKIEIVIFCIIFLLRIWDSLPFLSIHIEESGLLRYIHVLSPVINHLNVVFLS